MKFLNDREELVLRTIIDEYIDTNEPVSSRNVSKIGPLKMSSATIRNIMSDLVDKGYIIQPHTSAGRVPTDVGYRYYIDKLVSVQSVKSDIFDDVKKQMADDPVNVMNMFRMFTKKLGDMTNSIGFIVSPKLNSMYMKHIEFVRLNKGVVLAILVARSGIVQNVLLNVGDSLSENDLVRMSNYLNDNFENSSLNDIKHKLMSEISQDFLGIADLHEKTQAIGRVLFNSSAFDEELILEGTRNILDIPELKDSGKLQEVLKTFEEKRSLCNMLDGCMFQNGVQIFVGSEICVKGIDELGIVIKPYQRGGDIIGTMGIIGPKRMNYTSVVSIVDYSAKFITEMLNEYYGGEKDE